MIEKQQHLLITQIEKIKTFIFILIFLFAANIVINMFFDWGGLAPVVRVYVFFFSFLIIFNFTDIDMDAYKKYYKEQAGAKGIYYAFFVTRIVPFIFIYFVIASFLFINRIGSSEWLISTTFRLLTGAQANIIFYALILLVVLKLKRTPQFTIPVFIGLSVVYYFIDSVMPNSFSSGMSLSLFKFTKYFIFAFVLLFEFYYDRKRILNAIAFSLGFSLFCFWGVLGIFFFTYKFSDEYSFAHRQSSFIILSKGFSFPLAELQAAALERKDTSEISRLIYYSKMFNRKLEFDENMWMKSLFRDTPNQFKIVAEYLDESAIRLPFEMIAAEVKIVSEKDPGMLVNSPGFIKYFSGYIPENEEYIYLMYNESGRETRIFLLRSLAKSGSKKNIEIIVDGLTAMDRGFAEEVYSTLKEITGEDPAARSGLPINDPSVIAEFRRIARMMDREN